MHQPFFVPNAKSVKNTNADEAGDPRAQFGNNKNCANAKTKNEAYMGCRMNR